jgi:ABC-type transporter Mla subunit MlaD
MSATKKTKKKSVSTPLHLLHQLSSSLLEHLEDACSRALTDAEKLLGKLEKQRGKAQEKLHDARVSLQDAAAAGKAKAQAKAKDAVAELEELLDTLRDRQTETRNYIVGLKRDAQESLKLAQGVGKVKEAVNKVLGSRDAKPAAPASKPVAKPAAKAASKPVASTPAVPLAATAVPAGSTSPKTS